MDSELTQEASVFAADLAKVLADRGDARYQGMPSDADSSFAYRKMGEAGLIGLHWPTRLGGRGHSLAESNAVEEIFGYHWLPLSSYLLSVKSIGNALLRSATPELVERLLPSIAAGELVFCQGFSEPEAGSDLASLSTRARVEDDHFVVNGRKIWTSSAEHADWVYLAVRTDPNEDRHRGLTVLVAEMATPGIEVAVHRTLGGGTLGELLLENVVIPRDQIVGELHRGWSVLMGTMDYERVTTEKIGIARRLLDDLEPYATTDARRRTLRELRGQCDAARLHAQRATCLLEGQQDAAVAASMSKLSVAKLLQRLAITSAEFLGPLGLIEPGHPDAPGSGRFAAFRRASVAVTIAGGASDIQRRVIARRGLVTT